jgi:GMP synthase (glutamine-hydrolysing)
MLGICYGQQTHGRAARRAGRQWRPCEFGRAFIEITADECVLVRRPVVAGRAPPGLDEPWRPGRAAAGGLPHRRASRPARRLPATVHDERRFYGVQFHPEVVHTPDGGKLLANFVRHVCGLAGDWTMAEFRAGKIAEIREQVGSGRVICGLSGGVDSAVAAVLIHEAIGEQLTCVFVDHGLMRADEAEQVVSLFRNHYNIPLVHVDAERLFLDGLAGLTDPEAKRKFIGRTFIDIFEEEARKIGGADFLAQGTLVPGRDRKRQLHRRPVRHDQEPPQCRRPARTHEHEARRAASRIVQGRGARTRPRAWPAAGLCRPPSLSRPRPCHPHPRRSHQGALRHPAQGRRHLSRRDPRAGLYDAIWQAFAVLLPVKTVGVMGDGRTYDNVCALRAVTSTDGMTADIYPFDSQFPEPVATRIINEVRGINRVVYDYTSKPPGTIEWE